MTVPLNFLVLSTFNEINGMNQNTPACIESYLIISMHSGKYLIHILVLGRDILLLSENNDKSGENSDITIFTNR